MFAGITRMDMHQQAGVISAPASLGASWLTGLIGAVMLCAGVYLLRAAYLSKGKAVVAASPGRQRLLAVLAIVGAIALAGLFFFSRRQQDNSLPGSSLASGAVQPDSPGSPSAQVPVSKADGQLNAKLQLVIGCLNETFTHYEEIAGTYRAEVTSLSATNTPLQLGVQPMEGYFDVAGTGSPGDPARECADGLDRLVSMPPAISDLDDPAKDAAAALRAIAGPGREMDAYLQQKGYLDDRFSKGRQLDGTIAPLLNRILADSKQLRAVAVRENHTLRVHELDAVAKTEGHSMRWQVLNTMLASRGTEDEVLQAFRNRHLDLPTVVNALQPLQAAFDQGQQLSRAHPEAQGSEVVWTAIERAVGAQLADLKELREALAHPESNEASQQDKLRDLVKNESSDFDNAVEMYNGAIRY